MSSSVTIFIVHAQMALAVYKEGFQILVASWEMKENVYEVYLSENKSACKGLIDM